MDTLSREMISLSISEGLQGKRGITQAAILYCNKLAAHIGTLMDKETIIGYLRSYMNIDMVSEELRRPDLKGEQLIVFAINHIIKSPSTDASGKHTYGFGEMAYRTNIINIPRDVIDNFNSTLKFSVRQIKRPWMMPLNSRPEVIKTLDLPTDIELIDGMLLSRASIEPLLSRAFTSLKYTDYDVCLDDVPLYSSYDQYSVLTRDIKPTNNQRYRLQFLPGHYTGNWGNIHDGYKYLMFRSPSLVQGIQTMDNLFGTGVPSYTNLEIYQDHVWQKAEIENAQQIVDPRSGHEIYESLKEDYERSTKELAGQIDQIKGKLDILGRNYYFQRHRYYSAYAQEIFLHYFFTKIASNNDRERYLVLSDNNISMEGVPGVEKIPSKIHVEFSSRQPVIDQRDYDGDWDVDKVYLPIDVLRRTSAIGWNDVRPPIPPISSSTFVPSLPSLPSPPSIPFPPYIPSIPPIPSLPPIPPIPSLPPIPYEQTMGQSTREIYPPNNSMNVNYPIAEDIILYEPNAWRGQDHDVFIWDDGEGKSLADMSPKQIDDYFGFDGPDEITDISHDSYTAEGKSVRTGIKVYRILPNMPGAGMISPMQAPVGQVQAPVEQAQAPVEQTQAPVEQAPVEQAQAPVEQTQAPVEQAQDFLRAKPLGPNQILELTRGLFIYSDSPNSYQVMGKVIDVNNPDPNSLIPLTHDDVRFAASHHLTRIYQSALPNSGQVNPVPASSSNM